MENNYSVLMSVYYKEKPEYLYQSMQSIYEQTVKTNNFVLVCDGTLPDALNKVIEEMQQKFGERLYVHRLHKNGGLGRALNIGMKDCHYELIARMDSDDISHKDRCEKEIRVFTIHPEVSIVSGTVEEFTENIHNIHSRRMVPEYQKEIMAFAKKRNPFNHPCVMYKKSAVENVGGYQDFFLLEDYFLWIRMLKDGFVGYNIQEPILWMRAGKGLYQRRGGWQYIQSQRKLFIYMKKIRFISSSRYYMQIISRVLITMMPYLLRKIVFRLFLRE